MICPNCNAEISECRFCPHCGHSFENVVYPENSYSELDTIEENDKSNDEKTEINNSKKTMIIFGIIFALIALIIIIPSIPISKKTKAFKAAIESKNPDTIYVIYMDSDSEIREKFNKIIDNKIDDMISEIKAYQFYDDASKNCEAVDDWIDYNWDGLYWGAVDYNHDFQDVFNQSNEIKWDELEQVIEDTDNYCLGVNEYVAENDYKNAIKNLSKIESNSYIYNSAALLYEDAIEVYQQQCIASADDYVSKDDVPKAIEFLSGTIEFLDEIGSGYSDSLTEKMNQIKSEYAEKYANEAKSEFSKGNVDSAIGKMKVANEYQPENPEYREKIKEYEQYKPFELYKKENTLTIEWENSAGGLKCINRIEANDRNEYKNAIKIYHEEYDNDEKYLVDLTYNLAGKYDIVTGYILVDQAHKSDEQEGYFEAYGDGKLIYTSPKVGPGILPQNISFSVKNIQMLEIKFLGSTDIGWGTTYYVSDLIAQKSSK